MRGFIKSITIVFLVLISLKSFALEADVITRLVKEDISQGKLISGKRFVDKLEFVACYDGECLFNFQYFTDGCAMDYCWDLDCSGDITFDLSTLESRLSAQSCLDL